MTERHWLTRPATIRKLWIAGGIVLASTVAAQVAIPPHGYFGLDELFGFNAGFGLLTCIAMVLFAKALGFLLKRKDTYYDD